MSRKLAAWMGVSLVAALSAIDSAAAYEPCCFRCDCTRGSAITSPLECPDLCPSPVGGCYLYSPYYCGYGINRRCLPPMYGTVFTHGLSAPPAGTVALGRRSVPSSRGDFGSFTGASQDEQRLLHLGGFGPSGESAATPRPVRSPDIIDRLQGSR